MNTLLICTTIILIICIICFTCYKYHKLTGTNQDDHYKIITEVLKLKDEYHFLRNLFYNEMLNKDNK